MKFISLRLFLMLIIFLLLAGYVQAKPFPPGSSYKMGCSPSGSSLEIVLDAINAAKVSIYVAAYSFTSKPIAEALREAYRRGVDVRVLADQKGNSGKYTAVTFLANQGVPVRLNSQYAIMHHKFMIIDDKHVQTGSFNYSAAAVNRNAENVLLLLNVPELAQAYIKQWHILWEGGEELPTNY